MAGVFDLKSDLTTVADGLQSVRLVRAGTLAPVVFNKALRRAIGTTETAPSGGRVTSSDVVWHVPADPSSAPPEIGDRLVDSTGLVWAILETRIETLSARWRCRARRLAIADRLDAYVTLQQATWSKGLAGAPVATWTDVAARVPAHIQPLEVNAEIRQQRGHGESTHRVWFAANYDLTVNHRLVDAAGRIYRVLKMIDLDRIDALPGVNVERVDVS